MSDLTPTEHKRAAVAHQGSAERESFCDWLVGMSPLLLADTDTTPQYGAKNKVSLLMAFQKQEPSDK